MAYQLSKEAKVNFVPFKNFLDKIILNLQQTVILRVITYNLGGPIRFNFKQVNAYITV